MIPCTTYALLQLKPASLRIILSPFRKPQHIRGERLHRLHLLQEAGEYDIHIRQADDFNTRLVEFFDEAAKAEDAEESIEQARQKDVEDAFAALAEEQEDAAQDLVEVDADDM